SSPSWALPAGCSTPAVSAWCWRRSSSAARGRPRRRGAGTSHLPRFRNCLRAPPRTSPPTGRATPEARRRPCRWDNGGVAGRRGTEGRMVQWHPLFAQLLRPLVEAYYDVQTNVPVGDAPRAADLVLLQRTSAAAPPFRGLWQWLSTWNVLEF